MKKINRFAFVLAGALAAGTFIGCQQQTPSDYVYRIGAPSNLKAKAMPGVVFISWNPVQDCSGYTLVRINRDTNETKTLAGTTKDLSYVDRISTDNEWVDGQNFTYSVQAVSSGASGRIRSMVNYADVIGSSDWTSVDVKAVNNGFNSAVVYQVPYNLDGDTKKDRIQFADYDYSDKSEGNLKKLQEPASSVSLDSKGQIVVSVEAVPYLTYTYTVESEDASETVDFVMKKTEKKGEKDVPLSASSLGNARFAAPIIGKNVVYAKIADGNGYYAAKKFKAGEVSVEAADNVELSFTGLVPRISADKKNFELLWTAPKVNGKVNTKDLTYYFYVKGSTESSKEAAWMKAAFSVPEFDSAENKMKAVLGYDASLDGKEFKIYAYHNNKRASTEGSGKLASYAVTWDETAQAVYTSADKASYRLCWAYPKYKGESVTEKVTWTVTKNVYKDYVKATKTEPKKGTLISGPEKVDVTLSDSNLLSEPNLMTQEFSRTSADEVYTVEYTICFDYDGTKTGTATVPVDPLVTTPLECVSIEYYGTYSDGKSRIFTVAEREIKKLNVNGTLTTTYETPAITWMASPYSLSNDSAAAKNIAVPVTAKKIGEDDFYDLTSGRLLPRNTNAYVIDFTTADKQYIFAYETYNGKVYDGTIKNAYGENIIKEF